MLVLLILYGHPMICINMRLEYGQNCKNHMLEIKENIIAMFESILSYIFACSEGIFSRLNGLIYIRIYTDLTSRSPYFTGVRLDIVIRSKYVF